MFWFNSKKAKKEVLNTQAEEASIEVAKHKKKQHQVIAQTQQIADNFKQTIAENGFTIRIHAAAGGKRH